MKRLVPLLLSAFAVAAHAQTPIAPPPPQTYDAFRLVRSRNIFDPDRRGLRAETAPVVASSRAGGPLPNYITLTGAMVTAGRKLAFFSGARPEYSKVVSPNGKIADFTVSEITAAQVQLQLNGKAVVVAVGQNVPLEGSGAARLPGLQSAPEIAPPPTLVNPAPSSAVNSAPPPAAGAPAGSTDEIMRRMMERRQKELAK